MNIGSLIDNALQFGLAYYSGNAAGVIDAGLDFADDLAAASSTSASATSVARADTNPMSDEAESA